MAQHARPQHYALLSQMDLLNNAALKTTSRHSCPANFIVSPSYFLAHILPSIIHHPSSPIDLPRIQFQASPAPEALIIPGPSVQSRIRIDGIFWHITVSLDASAFSLVPCSRLFYVPYIA